MRRHRAVRLEPEEDIDAENLSLDPRTCGLFTVALLVATTPAARPSPPAPTCRWWLQKYPDVAKKNNVKSAVKCNVCHVGTSKENRNDYGKAIIKGLDGKKKSRRKQGHHR